MADDMLNNLDKLTHAVEKLTSKVDILDSKVLKTTQDVNGLGGAASSVDTNGPVSPMGGQSNLTMGSTSMRLGTDSARFNTAPMQTSTSMQTALGKFSYKWDTSSVDRSFTAMATLGDNMGGGGDGTHGFLGVDPVAASQHAGLAAADLAMAGIAGTYASMPDLTQTMQRNISYYQAALRTPGVNQSAIAKQGLSAMKGGLSQIGGDAVAYGTLASAGFTAGSANINKYMGEVGSAFKYLGMDNATAAQSLAQLQSGPSAANLFQYGITTTDAKGNMKSTKEIIDQVAALVNPGGIKQDPSKYNENFLKGYGNSVLEGLFQGNTGMQDIVRQGLIDKNAGRAYGLDAAPTANNPNTALTATGRMNASQTDLMDAATGAMIKGFENATDTVEAFNRALKNTVGVAGYAKGYMAGVGGTNVGQGIAAALPFLTDAAGQLLAAVHSLEPGLVAGGNPGYGGRGIGGPTVGFGSSSGGSGGTGGNSAVPGSIQTAGFGDKGNVWAGTNQSHTGQDFAAPMGSPVKVTADGTVVQTDLGSTYGKSILVDHGSYQTLYAHLSAEDVKVGDTVSKGQVIGKVGDTGNATGPHLHYEVRQGKNNPVDPNSIVSITTPDTGGTAQTTTANLGLGGSTNDMFNQGFASARTTSENVFGSTSLSGSIDGSPDVKLPAMADSELVGILKQAGFTGKALAVAYGVAKAESGGRPTAYNGKGLDNSYGLFQINLYGGLRQERLNKEWKTADGSTFKLGSDQDLYDPLKNAEVAYHMSNGGTNWGAWTTYTSGKYLANVDKVPTGGPTVASGAAVPTMSAQAASTTHGGNKTVNVTLNIQKASDEEAIRFAKTVAKYLENIKEDSRIGGS